MRERLLGSDVPPIIHLLNVVALLLGTLILLLAAVDTAYWLIALVPVLALLVAYWRVRTNPSLVAGYFGISIVLLGWILVCENLVVIDNVFDTLISQRLSLGLRLLGYVDANLHTRRRTYSEPCCDDRLTEHYSPGSLYRETYDCKACNPLYEVTVDETGYLNQSVGLWERHEQIDLFLAGDSLMQGIGMPSVLERLRAQIPLTMWNLSIRAYGPRQKISALLTYALPKRPKWLIVEFYAGNDVLDDITNELCDSTNDFRCRFSKPEVKRRLSRDPVYGPMLNVRADIFEAFAYEAAQNLTLATTKYVTDVVKGAFERTFLVRQPWPSSEDERQIYNARIAGPADSDLSRGDLLAYVRAGMVLTHKSYERLVTQLAALEQGPTVILLYNPSPYELYRDIWASSKPDADQVSAFQREALIAFADTHNWRFLDLTTALRKELQARKVWIFGRYDRIHWSHQGSEIVAAVLGAELLRIISLRN